MPTLVRHAYGPAAFVICLAGCNRYEYRTIQCESRPPAAASAIGWEPIPHRSGSIEVSVRATGTGTPILGNGTAASLDSAAWHQTAADGAVRFDSIPPGRHTLMVRAIGYHLALAPVVMQPDSGVAALAVMAQARTLINEACGATYRVRKPWWQP